MATQMKSVLTTISSALTGGQTFDVTGFGFQPKAYIVIINGRADGSDAVGRANAQYGIGFFATKHTSVVCDWEDAGASAVGRSNISSTEYLLALEPTNGVFHTLVHNSFLPDGIRFEVDIQFAADKKMLVIGFGGDDIINVWNGFKLTPTATGDEDYTGLGFDPGDDTLLIFAAAPDAFNADPDPNTSGSGNVAQMMFGAVHTGDATNQYVTAMNSDIGAATMLTDSYSKKGECVANVPTAGGNPNIRASFVQSISDGFRLTFPEVQGTTRPFMVLAIKGGNFKLGDFVTKTNDTDDIVVSDLGFVPSSALFVSHCLPESASDVSDAGARLSMGACNGTTDEVALAFYDEDNTANQETNTAIRHSDVYGNIADDGTIQGAMRAQSFDTDGFKMRMSDADPSAALVWFITGGEPLLEPRGGFGGGNQAWGQVPWGSVPAPEAGGGSVTLPADAGAFALTGGAAALKAARLLAAGSGSFSFTGQTASLEKGYKLSAEAAAFVLAGGDVAFRATRLLTATSGSFTLTGADAGLAKGRTLVADTGTFALTGGDAALVAMRKLAADSGSFTLSGADVTLAKGRTLIADSGVYTLVGGDATLRTVRKIIADGGVFGLTGTAANLRATRYLQANSGSFSFTGQQAALKSSRKIAAGSGTFALTGSAADIVRRGRMLDAQSGSFGFVGADVTFVTDHVAAARRPALGPIRRRKPDTIRVVPFQTEAEPIIDFIMEVDSSFVHPHVSEGELEYALSVDVEEDTIVFMKSDHSDCVELGINALSDPTIFRFNKVIVAPEVDVVETISKGHVQLGAKRRNRLNRTLSLILGITPE